MLKKKKNLLFASSLAGLIVGTTALSVALSSCATGTDISNSSNVQYSYNIDWNDEEQVERLIIDNSGLVYSDNSKTTIIAVSPKVMISTVTIPDTVKNIAGYVKVTTNASGVKIYEQVGAFQGITSLNTVIIPTGSKLKTIGSKAFYGCTGLININLDNIIAIGDYAFMGAFNKDAKITVSLPSITSVGEYAFSESNIYGVDFSKSTNLYNIGRYAFRNALSLTSPVDLSNCVKLLETGGGSFYGCTNLTTVYIPSEGAGSLRSISWHTFINCTNLTTVGPKGTKEGSLKTTTSMQTIGANAFAYTKIIDIDLTQFTIPPGQKHTGSLHSFTDMRYVTSIELPEGMTEIPISTGATKSNYFSNVGILGEGFSITLPSTITNIGGISDGPSGAPVYGAFSNSGVKFIDMSKIKSNSSSTTTPNRLNSCVFYNCPKLENVVLKRGTNGFGSWSFSSCPNLKWIVEANEDGTYSTPTSNGYVAPSGTTFEQGVFQKAFSEDSNAIVDLSNTTMTNLPGYTFDTSNVKEVKLPTSIVTIDESAFRNQNSTSSKLDTVNFKDLVNLTTISGNNFNRSSLTDIDLSNTKFSSITTGGNSTKSFTNLPVGAHASLPTTLTSGFRDIFTDTSGNSIPFSFPRGINSGFFSGTNNNILSNGTLQNLQTVNSGSASVLKNASVLDLSNTTNSSTSIKSIGANTFFGSSKLNSLTMSANEIQSANIFTASAISNLNDTNTNSASTQYVTNNIPFGNNESFTTLNYTNFASTNISSYDSSVIRANEESTTTPQTTLFNSTNQDIWTKVTKIINSLSYQTYTTGENTNVASLKSNMSAWAPTSSSSISDIISPDAAATFTTTSGSASQVSLSNSFIPSSSNTGNPTTPALILATDISKTFIHNGITWTYKNDGTTITLTGDVNMYKASNNSNSYLVFFNQTTYTTSGDNPTTYYVPSSTPVTVTLTIASNASTNS